jgi:hypothetical protein
MRGDTAARPLLNGTERRLYGRLVRAFPGHVILSQVAMSRLLPADPAAAAVDGQSSGAGVRQAVAAFVVCRPDFTPLAVIEFDDPTDAVPAGQPAAPPGSAAPSDAARYRGRLESAGIKQIRVSAGDLPSEAALKALVAAMPLGASLAERMRRAS